MFLGHYAVAFAAKRAAPRTSLGVLVLAAEWLDEIWPVFLLLGWERVRIVPGLMAASPMDFEHYPISHSLLLVLGWSALLGLAYFALRRYRRGAWVVALVVASHWVLDLLVHRPDLPLWPGGPRLGLGLWNSLPATVVLELGFFGAGLWIYFRFTRALDRIGSWGAWAMAALLLVIYVASSFGPPPPDARSVAVASLALWIFVPWGWWVDRHREVRGDLAAANPAAARTTSPVPHQFPS